MEKVLPLQQLLIKKFTPLRGHSTYGSGHKYLFRAFKIFNEQRKFAAVTKNPAIIANTDGSISFFGQGPNKFLKVFLHSLSKNGRGERGLALINIARGLAL